MAHRVIDWIKTAMTAALWTASIGGTLLVVDRWVAPLERPRWTEGARLEDVPPAARPLMTPAYLPSRIDWPPRRVWYRADADPGWWVMAVDRESQAPALWLGAQREGTPDVLGELASCLEETGRCPEGWHVLSRPLEDGRPVFVLTMLPRTEARRILEGLVAKR